LQQNTNGRELSALGWLFFSTITVHVLAEIALGLLQSKGITFPVEVTLTLSELTILVPSVIYILIRNLNFKEDLGFRRIKTGAVFMCIPLSFFVTPVASFINVLSQLFVSNTMVQNAGKLMGGSSLALLFLGALYGPFCEEFMFRSIFNNRYEIYTGPLRAGFISALFFALMHMNLNQANYAFVLGVIFSIINKAAGSVYPSMIIHTCINGGNIALMIVMTKAAKLVGDNIDIGKAAEEARKSNVIYVMIGATLVVAIISSALAIPCVVWLSKNEGQSEQLRDMFCNKHKSEKWLTFSTVLALVLVLFIMIGLGPVMAALKEN